MVWQKFSAGSSNTEEVGVCFCGVLVMQLGSGCAVWLEGDEFKCCWFSARCHTLLLSCC